MTSALFIMCHSVTRLEVKIWSLLKLSVKMYYLKALLIKFKSLTVLSGMEEKQTVYCTIAFRRPGKYSQAENPQKKKTRHFPGSGGLVPDGWL